jgi:Periplasmic binding proteins and sugar binding domain of LacI family
VPRGADPAANPIFNQLLLSLLWSARAAGYRLQPFATGKEPGSRAPHYQQLWEQREVAGFIVADPADDERLGYLQDSEVPFVLVGRLAEEAGYCWVDTDNAAGSVMAVQHLAAQGHQHIAYLGWPASDAVADRRLEGYRRGLAAAGTSPNASGCKPTVSPPWTKPASCWIARPGRPQWWPPATSSPTTPSAPRPRSGWGVGVGRVADGGRLRRLPPGRTNRADPDQPAAAHWAAGRPGDRPADRQARQPRFEPASWNGPSS